jgi:hypothetical protein
VSLPAASPVPAPLSLAAGPQADGAARSSLAGAGAAAAPTAAAKPNPPVPRRDGAGRPRVAAPHQAIAIEASTDDFSQAGPLLGDNPLDVFSDTSGAGLELAFEVPAAPAATSGRKAPETAERERRAPAASQARGAQHRATTEASTARARRPGMLWAIPAVLLLLLAVGVLFPGWFSLAPPDQAAARAREARQPATRGSSHTLQSARREPVGPADVLAPALRELQ